MIEYKKNKLKEVLNITHVINVTYYRFSKNFVFEGETHDFWEFVYIDKGELIITAENCQYLLKAGELAFHKPNEFHSICATGNAANATVVSFVCLSRCMKSFEHKILFLNDFEKELLSIVLFEAEQAYKPLQKSPPIISLQKQKSAPFGADQLIKSGLEQMLIHIYRRQDSIHIRQRTICSNLHHNYQQLVKNIKELLENNLSQKITLDFISNELKISISQIKKVFKQETGLSIITYLTNLRINEAKRLIHESTLNFTQISEEVGYDNIYYFSKLFKEKTGMTLTEYSLSIKH